MSKARKVSELICEKILTDNDFSLDVAKLLGVQQYSVKELAKRRSDRLVIYDVVEYYRIKGLTQKDIFE